MAIGVFDSGLGGLTVVKAIRKLHPHTQIVYLGDTARVPYGGRSADVIVRYALECSQFLISKNVESIVVACNTVSALAIPAIAEQAEMPVFGVIDPGAKEASKYNHVGLLATRATVDSRAYEKALKQFNPRAELVSVASPLLVPLVEEGWGNGQGDPEVVSKVIRHYLTPLVDAQVESIILGCTHYPILKDAIEVELKRMGKMIPLIDSGEVLARSLDFSDTPSDLSTLEVYTTDGAAGFKKRAEAFLNETVEKVLQAEL